MFIGRNQEVSILEEYYNSKKFQFFVIHGRRRVGKTSLLQEFSKCHKTIFFSAQEKNDALNLADFSKTVFNFFGNRYLGNFNSWTTDFCYTIMSCFFI